VLKRQEPPKPGPDPATRDKLIARLAEVPPDDSREDLAGTHDVLLWQSLMFFSLPCGCTRLERDVSVLPCGACPCVSVCVEVLVLLCLTWFVPSLTAPSFRQVTEMAGALACSRSLAAQRHWISAREMFRALGCNDDLSCAAKMRSHDRPDDEPPTLILLGGRSTRAREL
jgi:hypothetical protein